MVIALYISIYLYTKLSWEAFKLHRHSSDYDSATFPPRLYATVYNGQTSSNLRDKIASWHYRRLISPLPRDPLESNELVWFPRASYSATDICCTQVKLWGRLYRLHYYQHLRLLMVMCEAVWTYLGGGWAVAPVIPPQQVPGTPPRSGVPGISPSRSSEMRGRSLSGKNPCECVQKRS